MNNNLYQEIFKRKSYHLFREKTGEPISQNELNDIIKAYKGFDPLIKDIKTDIKVVKAEDTTCKRGEEYCLLLYSQKKDNYLQNIGYLGEQLDLYLISKGIGSLWFGIAKVNDTYNGLDYVIMIAIGKVNAYRKDMFKAKRKELVDIWKGEDLNVANIVRFAPSACNSQPWFVENDKEKLYVYRKSKSGKVGIMPKNASVYYNQIDIGIFMCFLDLCLNHEGIKYKKEVVIDSGSYDKLELNAIYTIS